VRGCAEIAPCDRVVKNENKKQKQKAKKAKEAYAVFNS
jgi:hypothetical protein